MTKASSSPRKIFNVALRDALIAAFVVLAVSAITGFVVYTSAAKGLKSEVQDNLVSLAQSASNFVDGDAHQLITKPEDKGSELYERVRAPFLKLLDANRNIAFIYTVIPKDEKIFLILDAAIVEPGKEDDTSGVMEEYTAATDTMKLALKTKQALVENESYTDEWGTFLSAYAPIYNSKHEFIGVVGADIRLTEYLKRLSEIHRALMWSMVIALFASIGVGVGVWIVRSAAVKSEAESRSQQIQMVEMEKARLAQQEQDKNAAEAQKRETMHSMADTFEASVKDVVAAVVSSAVTIQTGIEDVAKIAANTKERSEIVANASGEAAQMSAQVAAAAEELTSSVQEISSQTQRATQIAGEATHTAETAQQEIRSLAEKSQKVSEIVSVITGIAEQINLLALNATIESARAGEAGKGFAVVANEVKNLAGQAGKAAEEIAFQISDMQTATSSSVQAVMKIIAIIDNVSHTTTAVASAVEEQSAATNEIASNISRASDGTRKISDEIVNVQNGADQTGDTAAFVLDSANNLGIQSEMLKQKVDEFLRTIRA